MLRAVANPLASGALPSNVTSASLNSITPIGGALSIGSAAGAYEVRVDGNTVIGAALLVRNNSVPVICIANKSAIFGGAYDATPMLYGTAPIEVNQALNVTGAISATTRVNYPSFTVATLPAVGSAGGNIYVSDESGGAQPAFSDGTNWRRYTDRAVVS